MNERWCPTCNRHKPGNLFKRFTSGKLARDCMQCNEERRIRQHAAPPQPSVPIPHNNGFALRSRAKGPSREFPGVDIDRIHYVRGAIRKKAAA